jgi:predicted permease
VFLFSLGAGVLAALVVGGLTAWRSTRVPPAGVLASSGLASGLTAAGRGVRTTMVAIQVTAAVVLVMACGFYLETMVSQLVDRGVIGRRIQYDSDRVVTARVDLRQHDFSEARGRSFFDQGLRRAAAIGGVEAIALGSGLPGAAGPLRPGEMYLMLEAPPEGLAGDARRGVADFAVASPGYLTAIGLPLRRGREFVETDADGATLVGVVSEGAAATLWPGQDAIGKRFRFNADFLTVVGVSANPVGASERGRFDLRTPNFVFVPFAQHYRPSMALVARSAAPAALIEALRATVAAVDPEVAVIDAATAEDSALAWWAPARAALMLIGGLAAAALGIAMLGVYGVLQFFVSSRTREFGIRTALGASSGRVIKLVLDEAVHIVLVGLLVGVLVAALGSRVIEFRQFGVMPNSITNWVVVPLLILGSGLLAGYLPARRAARVDPTVALRSL